MHSWIVRLDWNILLLEQWENIRFFAPKQFTASGRKHIAILTSSKVRELQSSLLPKIIIALRKKKSVTSCICIWNCYRIKNREKTFPKTAGHPPSSEHLTTSFCIFSTTHAFILFHRGEKRHRKAKELTKFTKETCSTYRKELDPLLTWIWDPKN